MQREVKKKPSQLDNFEAAQEGGNMKLVGRRLQVSKIIGWKCAPVVVKDERVA